MILPACCAAATATVLKSCMCSSSFICILAHYITGAWSLSHDDLQRRTSIMNTISRRRFLQLSAAAGGALAYGDVALAVGEMAKQENKLFMATCPHIMELTGSRCNSHTFAFMPNARMMAEAVAPHIVKVFGKQWYMVTADTVDGKSALQAM